ncbi:MAG: diacylglycerol kinase family lipid kinase [Acidobacteria bacterium]|nr:MAG: diacylglycerol kinase family lipid kinase [Acidobacteriota bacterium]
MIQRMTIIHNPVSGRRGVRPHQLDSVRLALDRVGIESECFATRGPGHATELAMQALARGTELILVRGGDGTLNEVLQAMVGSGVPLAIWPGGTANVLARVLGLPRTPDCLISTIISGHTRTITVGQAGRRYFFLMAGIGLDASIVRHLNPRLKRLGGLLAFWASGFQHVARWPAPAFTLRVDGNEYRVTFATLANAPYYGGGLRLAPQARLDAVWLDVCAFRTRNKLRYLLVHLPSSFFGRHIRQRGVIYLKTREARAESSEDIWVQVDGELIGHLPMTFRSIPEAIRVCIPPDAVSTVDDRRERMRRSK